MTYTKPLVSKLDTTTEVAMCRPCLTVDGFTVQVGRQTISVEGTSTGGRCPVQPAPDTPTINGVDIGPIGDVGDAIVTPTLPPSFETGIGGYDVAVTF